MPIEPVTHLEKAIAGTVEPVTHLEQVISEYGGGSGGGSVTSVNGKTGAVVLSAADVGALPDDTPIPAAVTEQTVSGWGFTKNTGTYSKPSGGIPKTDLASDVQTSLGKADTALQSSDLSSAIDSALAQAKASGEFDGADGAPGAKGDKGDKGDAGATGATGPQGPAGQNGSDYVLTNQDKTDIAAIVLQALPTWNGGAY